MKTLFVVVIVLLAIAILLAVAALVIKFFDFLEKRKKKKIIKGERRGEYLPSNSGIVWTLSRKDAGNGYKDSRELLERLGFRILGIVDEMLYSVEPPLGWSNTSTNHPLYEHILDSGGNKRLLSFYKNDIMNPSDYRTYVSEIVD